MSRSSTLEALARSRIAGVALVALGFLLLGISVEHAGVERVVDALFGAALLAPIALLLEAGIVTFDMLALSRLYGDARRTIGLGSWLRAGLLGYPVMCLAPMGRALAEASRAAMLAPHTDLARAAAAAARLQGVLLLANGIISGACAVGAATRMVSPIIPIAIGANGVVMMALGALVLFAGARSRLGAALARLTSRAKRLGPELDLRLRSEPSLPFASIAFAVGARGVQIVQCMILVAAVGGRLGPIEGLSSEGINLVAGTLGDLIPGQLGASEATFAWTSQLLSLTSSQAISIALILHAVQMFWVAVGLVASLIWVKP